jgi:hypothetical protein
LECNRRKKPQVEREGGAVCDADSDSQASIEEPASALAKLKLEERTALMLRM